MPPVYLNQPSPNVAEGVAQAIKRLLSSKHLYQNLNISGATDFSCATEEQIAEVEFKLHSADLAFTGGQAMRTAGETLQVNLLNFETYCTRCGDRKPFASLSAVTSPLDQPALPFGELPPASQILHLRFKCQSCQTEQVDYLIVRKAKKLTIAGRWPVEEYPAPAFIPKELRDHYSKATITFNAGFFLAALVYLRVVIEQFWRSQNLADLSQRLTGDELGTLYKEKLPKEFNEVFPSLLDIYNQISGALHTANASAEIFEESLAKLERHFDGRRLFEL